MSTLSYEGVRAEYLRELCKDKGIEGITDNSTRDECIKALLTTPHDTYDEVSRNGKRSFDEMEREQDQDIWRNPKRQKTTYLAEQRSGSPSLLDSETLEEFHGPTIQPVEESKETELVDYWTSSYPNDTDSGYEIESIEDQAIDEHDHVPFPSDAKILYDNLIPDQKLSGNESLSEIRRIVQSHQLLNHIKMGGKGRNKTAIIEDINRIIRMYRMKSEYNRIIEMYPSDHDEEEDSKSDSTEETVNDKVENKSDSTERTPSLRYTPSPEPPTPYSPNRHSFHTPEYPKPLSPIYPIPQRPTRENEIPFSTPLTKYPMNPTNPSYQSSPITQTSKPNQQTFPDIPQKYLDAIPPKYQNVIQQITFGIYTIPIFFGACILATIIMYVQSWTNWIATPWTTKIPYCDSTEGTKLYGSYWYSRNSNCILCPEFAICDDGIAQCKDRRIFINGECVYPRNEVTQLVSEMDEYAQFLLSQTRREYECRSFWLYRVFGVRTERMYLSTERMKSSFLHQFNLEEDSTLFAEAFVMWMRSIRMGRTDLDWSQGKGYYSRKWTMSWWCFFCCLSDNLLAFIVIVYGTGVCGAWAIRKWEDIKVKREIMRERLEKAVQDVLGVVREKRNDYEHQGGFVPVTVVRDAVDEEFGTLTDSEWYKVVRKIERNRAVAGAQMVAGVPSECWRIVT